MAYEVFDKKESDYDRTAEVYWIPKAQEIVKLVLSPINDDSEEAYLVLLGAAQNVVDAEDEDEVMAARDYLKHVVRLLRIREKVVTKTLNPRSL
jgi:hypothetical protein